MKNKLFILTILASFTISTSAQKSQGTSVVTLGLGYSLFNNIVKTSLDTYQDVKVTSVPTIAFTYDYGLSDNFSLGLAGAFQSNSGTFTNDYFDENYMLQTENAKVSLSRINLALRPLFHYGKSDKLDMYSGLRVGYLVRNVKAESKDPDAVFLDEFDGNRFALGLVPFGFRYFFTDNIGMNMDLQIGTPYVVSGGIALSF